MSEAAQFWLLGGIIALMLAGFVVYFIVIWRWMR